MRAEKQYLVDEVASYLGKSKYLFLTNYTRITVLETADLRAQLSKLSAEFHVVKNSALKHAAAGTDWPDFNEALDGQTAIVVGGDSPSEVAKILIKFHKDKEKCEVKVGILEDRKMTREEVTELSKLPSLPELRAQLLSLFNTPATQMVRVMQAVPEGVLNVLQARSEQEQ